MRLLAAFVGLAVVCSAQAQEHLLVSVDEVSLGSWTITAELLNPDPNKELLAVIAEIGFYATGLNFSDIDLNNAFYNSFPGKPYILATSSSLTMYGSNSLPPLNGPGGPDSSNPFFIAGFEADRVDSFEFLDQVYGAYVLPPFADVFTYQNLDGSPGDVPFTIEINPIPGPGGAVLITGAALMGLQRRRR